MRSSEVHKLSNHTGAMLYGEQVTLYDITGYSARRRDTLTAEEMAALVTMYEERGVYTAFDLLNKIYEMADRGLHTDGAHHKQWYLERILELLASEDDRSFLEPWEQGVAP